jgi:flagellar biosynthesis anti-sigma factor FlgM
MRIDSNYGTQQAAETSSSPQPATTAAQSAGAHALAEDQAQLSGTHVQAATLVSQTLKLPEVRQERVAALRQALAGGRYHPAADEVAHAVLTHISGAAA